MLRTIKSVRRTVVYENGTAEESMQEFEEGVKIRIYGPDKAILLSQNYKLDFHCEPIRIYFNKYINEYGLKGMTDDYISVHVNTNGHHYYFTVKKSNEISSQFTYRMDNGTIYRSRAYPVKYSDFDNILAICSSIAGSTAL